MCYKPTNIVYQVHMYSPMDYTHQGVLKMRQHTALLNGFARARDVKNGS